MRKSGKGIQQVANGIQLESGEMPSENSAVSKVSNQINEIVWGGLENEFGSQNSVNIPNRTTIGKELDTSDTGLPPLPAIIEFVPGSIAARARWVALNESGTQRIGEDHARAKLTNAQVETIRDQYEAHPLGHPEHVGYRVLAQQWGVSKRTIRDICNYAKRNQWAGRWKRIP